MHRSSPWRPLIAIALVVAAFSSVLAERGMTAADDGVALIQTRSWDADVRIFTLQPEAGGDASLLMVVGRRIFALTGSGRRWTLEETFIPPVVPYGGATLTDVTGDGRKNLVVGTDGPGSVYVYRRGRSGWEPVGRTDYLWSPVRSLVAADITGGRRADLLVTGEDGRAHLFSWTFGEFLSRWRSPRDGYSFVDAADLTGDGRSEVVVAREEGYLAVWGWQDGALHLLWENYPWGDVVGATLGDVDGDGLDDIVVNTSQRLLYVFGWDGAAFRLKRQVSHPLLPMPHLALAPLDSTGDGRPSEVGLLAAGGRDIIWFRLGSSSALPLWSTRLTREVYGVWAVPGEPAFFLWDSGGVRILEPGPQHALHVLWLEEPAALQYRPLVENGILFLSARDVTDWLGWHLFWNEEFQRLTAVGVVGFFIAVVGEAEIVTPQGRQSLAAPVRLHDGQVYVPYDVVVAAGYRVKWDELTRTLTVGLPE